MALWGIGILESMGPSRAQVLATAVLFIVLVSLVVMIVVAAIPPGGPPTLK